MFKSMWRRRIDNWSLYKILDDLCLCWDVLSQALFFASQSLEQIVKHIGKIFTGSGGLFIYAIPFAAKVVLRLIFSNHCLCKAFFRFFRILRRFFFFLLAECVNLLKYQFLLLNTSLNSNIMIFLHFNEILLYGIYFSLMKVFDFYKFILEYF